MGKRTEPYPIPTSMPKREETKLFHIYWVVLLIK